MWRLPAAALLLVAGAATALATIALHARWWWLVYAMLTTVVVLVALPPRWWTRVAFAVGWLLMVGYAVLGRPEGDWVIASDLSGYTVLVAALVFTLAAALTSASSPSVEEVERDPSRLGLRRSVNDRLETNQGPSV